MKEKVENIITVSIISLCLFILIYYPLDYWITKNLMSTPKMMSLISNIVFVLVLIIVTFIHKKILMKNVLSRIFFLILIIVSAVVFLKIRQEKRGLLIYPKIYKLEPASGYQGETVKIKGRNFFNRPEKGRVFLGNMEAMSILSWSNDLITVELPIPEKFGTIEMFLIRKDGTKSNSKLFLIKDPIGLPK